MDLNAELRQVLDQRHYRAVCKGVAVLDDNRMVFTFEKEGDTWDTEIMADERGGLDVATRRREL